MQEYRIVVNLDVVGEKLRGERGSACPADGEYAEPVRPVPAEGYARNGFEQVCRGKLVVEFVQPRIQRGQCDVCTRHAIYPSARDHGIVAEVEPVVGVAGDGGRSSIGKIQLRKTESGAAPTGKKKVQQRK